MSSAGTCVITHSNVCSKAGMTKLPHIVQAGVCKYSVKCIVIQSWTSEIQNRKHGTSRPVHLRQVWALPPSLPQRGVDGFCHSKISLSSLPQLALFESIGSLKAKHGTQESKLD